MRCVHSGKKEYVAYNQPWEHHKMKGNTFEFKGARRLFKLCCIKMGFTTILLWTRTVKFYCNIKTDGNINNLPVKFMSMSTKLLLKNHHWHIIVLVHQPLGI